MKNVGLLNLSIGGLILRYYLMMALVLAIAFSGQFAIAAVVAVSLAASCILAVSLRARRKAQAEKAILTNNNREEIQVAA